jgi:hypothetical protein
LHCAPAADYAGDTFKPVSRQPRDSVMQINGW